MKPLDDYEKWVERLNEENLSEKWYNVDESRVFFKEFLEAPIHRFSPVLEWYFRAKWTDAFKKIKANAPIEVLELASGSQVLIPKVISKYYTDPQTKYTTFNLNKKLTAKFKESVKNLPLAVDIIEDAAQNVDSYIEKNKIDVVVFEHAINDILQGMLANQNGIDTIDSDWYEMLPKMVEIISAEYRNGTLDASVKNEFLTMLNSCLNVLKPNGIMVFSHHMYQTDLDLNYDVDLYENMINIVRKWINDAGIGIEVFFEDFEPQWWLFVQKLSK